MYEAKCIVMDYQHHNAQLQAQTQQHLQQLQSLAPDSTRWNQYQQFWRHQMLMNGIIRHHTTSNNNNNNNNNKRITSNGRRSRLRDTVVCPSRARASRVSDARLIRNVNIARVVLYVIAMRARYTLYVNRRRICDSSVRFSRETKKKKY